MFLLLLVVTLQYNNTMATSTSSQISNFDSSGIQALLLPLSTTTTAPTTLLSQYMQMVWNCGN